MGRRIIAPLGLVAASLWCTVVLAQSQPGAANEPAAESADDQNRPAEEPTKNEAEPTRTPKKDGKKKGKKGKATTTDSRSPKLTSLDELVVEAARPLSAASSQLIRARDFALRPHSTTQEILNNVPGLLVVQHQGGGKAVQYLIRGFDADHGTDFALFTDGIPVNMVTHAHGQGYADLNYLIPETVSTLELYKGPYFVQFGDFANAGVLNITTKSEFAQNFALAEGGYFATQRYVLGASLPVPIENSKSLLAAEAYFSNGPFENPNDYARYNVFTKLTVEPAPGARWTLLGSVYSGDWDGSGQIPERAVQEGIIGRFGSIDPSEGGHTDRENLSAAYQYKPSADEQYAFQLWGSRYHLRLWSDFTFFQQTGLRFYQLPDRSVVDGCTGLVCQPINPALDYIPGDEIVQADTRLLFGGIASYTRFWTLGGVPWLGDLPQQTSAAIQTRQDYIDLGFGRSVHRKRFLTVNQVAVGEQSVSGWVSDQFFLSEWARLELALRGDVFFFNVQNRLPPQPPDINFLPVPIQGNDVTGLASPKANAVFGPWYNTEIYTNFGTGFHSNDARDVALTGQSGLVRSIGTELGTRTRQFDRLDAAAAFWYLHLDSELIFSGDTGNIDADRVGGSFVPGPATNRWGVDFETRYQLTDWLFFDYDLSYAHARLATGDPIPLAPIIIMNGGLTADFHSGILDGFAAALRLRYLGDRPANEEDTLTAQGWTLLDLLLRYRWRNVEASLAFLNLTNTEWREAQFANPTCLLNEEGPNQPCPQTGDLPRNNFAANGVDGINFTPGNPFNIRGGLQVFF